MKSEVPKVGYLDLADPRLDKDLCSRILARGDALAGLVEKHGIRCARAGEIIDTEAKARAAVETMRQQDCCGIIIRTAWFFRANVVAGIVQAIAPTPCILWAVKNSNDIGFEGLGLAHGTLDEIGAPHQLHFGDATDEGVQPVVAWARACFARQQFMGAVYGEIGGRSLEMMPAGYDPNQLRKVFGIHVDPLEQRALIQRAETIEEGAWSTAVEEWKKSFGSIKCEEESLIRSAKLYLAGRAIFEERNWSFAGIQCQMEMIDTYLAPCLPVAMWNEDGFTVSCETDMNNALGMALCRIVTGDPAMFVDIFHYDIESHTIHALNCGTGAPSLAGESSQAELVEQTPLQGTWDNKNQCSLCKGGACCRFIMPPGPVTIVRFGRIDGEYVVHLADGRAVEHEFDPTEVEGLAGVWPFAYVQLDSTIEPESFVRNLRSHHAVICRAQCANTVREFARLLNIPVL